MSNRGINNVRPTGNIGETIAFRSLRGTGEPNNFIRNQHMQNPVFRRSLTDKTIGIGYNPSFNTAYGGILRTTNENFTAGVYNNNQAIANRNNVVNFSNSSPHTNNKQTSAYCIDPCGPCGPCIKNCQCNNNNNNNNNNNVNKTVGLPRNPFVSDNNPVATYNKERGICCIKPCPIINPCPPKNCCVGKTGC